MDISGNKGLRWVTEGGGMTVANLKMKGTKETVCNNMHVWKQLRLQRCTGSGRGVRKVREELEKAMSSRQGFDLVNWRDRDLQLWKLTRQYNIGHEQLTPAAEVRGGREGVGKVSGQRGV